MIGSNPKKDGEGVGALAAALERACERAGTSLEELPATRPAADGRKKKAEPVPPPALRVVKDGEQQAAPEIEPPVVTSSPVVVEDKIEAPAPVETPIVTTPAPTATAMPTLSFEDMGKLAALKGILPAGSEVKLPSGISVKLTETGVEMISTATVIPTPVVVEKKVEPPVPATANDTIELLNPFADKKGRQAMVAAGEAARERREKEMEARAKREQATRAEREKRVAYTREVLGAKLPELIASRKGAKPLAEFRGKDEKVDMGALARALGDTCAITDRRQRPGGGIILIVGEWGWMVDSGFDRDTAISMAKAEERRMRQAEAEKKEREALAALADLLRQSGKLVQTPLKDGKDLLSLPVFSKGGVPRLNWREVREALEGTPDPLTGEKVERPGAFLLSFPEDKEGEEAIKAAGLRVLSGFSRRLLTAHPDLLLPTGMQLVAVDALSERVNLLIDAASPASGENSPKAKKRRRGTGGGPPRGPKKGPSTEVHMRPLSPAEKRAPEPPPKPTTRKVGKRK